jgi:hypothetical protein
MILYFNNSQWRNKVEILVINHKILMYKIQEEYLIGNMMISLIKIMRERDIYDIYNK